MLFCAAFSTQQKKLTRAAAFSFYTLASHNLHLQFFHFHNALLCNSFRFSAATHILIHPCALKICCPCFSLGISVHVALHTKKKLHFSLLCEKIHCILSHWAFTLCCVLPSSHFLLTALHFHSQYKTFPSAVYYTHSAVSIFSHIT